MLFTCDNISKLDKWDGTEENITFNLKYITYIELQQHIKDNREWRQPLNRKEV